MNEGDRSTGCGDDEGAGGGDGDGGSGGGGAGGVDSVGGGGDGGGVATSFSSKPWDNENAMATVATMNAVVQT